MPKPKNSSTWKRSVVKSVTYRIVIVILDFTTVYLISGQIKVAIGFMVVSNLYTTLAYYLHERIWSGITWGRKSP